MFLINWFQANILMILTSLVLIGIPVVVLFLVFRRQKKEKTENRGV